MPPKRPDQGKEQELKALRDRLYSRTGSSGAPVRHGFSPVNRPANISPEAVRAHNAGEVHRIDEVLERPRTAPSFSPTRSRDTIQRGTSAGVPVVASEMPQTKKITLKGYRNKIIAVAVLFFVIALALSSAFLFFGQNTISGNNIAVDAHAPFTIGGGETLSVDVAVTNRNAVAVESATLVVEYPPGTQDADTAGKELFQQRLPLGSVRPGEVRQVPIKAKIFGEENEEKIISISVEYRVAGSNATFVKQADPLKIKVSSSPVVLSIDAVKEISSGQPVTLTLSLTSNSPSSLTDLLVQAEYPQGFDFSAADPKPVKGQNVWSIPALSPGKKEQITINGVMTGGSAEARTFNFSVGVPKQSEHFSLASVLTKGSTGITLTNPFVGLTVTTNGSADKTISVGQDASVNVSITFKNTLSDTIYDGTIKATLSGNGLNANNVSVASGGFYDSSTNTITWDKSGVGGLAALAPGSQETVTFSISGANLDAARTPEVSYTVSAAGRRVSESNVPQELTNIESRTVRFESATVISSHGLYSIGPFTNSGPQPPKAETATTYTIMLAAKNGSNELADAAVTMALPSYVTWSNAVTSGDDITYNATTRAVTWRIGTLGANSAKNAAFQVAFLPSVSQVGTVPMLVGRQSLRATDRFTGTVVRAAAEAVTTHLPDDPSPAAQVGRVDPK